MDGQKGVKDLDIHFFYWRPRDERWISKRRRLNWFAYWRLASSSSANMSSALANRALRFFTISSTSAMAR